MVLVVLPGPYNKSSYGGGGGCLFVRFSTLFVDVSIDCPTVSQFVCLLSGCVCACLAGLVVCLLVVFLVYGVRDKPNNSAHQPASQLVSETLLYADVVLLLRLRSLLVLIFVVYYLLLYILCFLFARSRVRSLFCCLSSIPIVTSTTTTQ